jgi:hypothetical protein
MIIEIHSKSMRSDKMTIEEHHKFLDKIDKEINAIIEILQKKYPHIKTHEYKKTDVITSFQDAVGNSISMETETFDGILTPLKSVNQGA